tara:strand:- start:418 stop:591 length:174 start_codon:yes stop_codon:yes gene_type:complete
VLPFIDDLVNDWFEITFDEDVSKEEIVWHQDRRDRKITIFEREDWQIQFDNRKNEND